jgi:hypothetical protein
MKRGCPPVEQPQHRPGSGKGSPSASRSATTPAVARFDTPPYELEQLVLQFGRIAERERANNLKATSLPQMCDHVSHPPPPQQRFAQWSITTSARTQHETARPTHRSHDIDSGCSGKPYARSWPLLRRRPSRGCESAVAPPTGWMIAKTLCAFPAALVDVVRLSAGVEPIGDFDSPDWGFWTAMVREPQRNRCLERPADSKIWWACHLALRAETRLSEKLRIVCKGFSLRGRHGRPRVAVLSRSCCRTHHSARRRDP